MIVYTIAMAFITSGFAIYWVVTPKERRVGPALPALLLGGAFAGLMESWFDNTILVTYPLDQPLPTLDSFGRSVPLFVPIGYAWFCGGLLYIIARAFQTNVTAGFVWKLYGAIIVIDFLAIGASSWIGILRFFGDPPMNIAGYPLWWAGIDGLAAILGGAVVASLLPHLRGVKQLWLIAVPPVVFAAAGGAVGWPISTALNSDWSMPAKYACALVSMAFSLACVRFITVAMPRQQLHPGATKAPQTAQLDTAM
ncbi:hypothetical protein ACWF9G_19060 [Nocardia sp. NPDC055029]